MLRDTYESHPWVPFSEYEDLYGNLCQRLVAPAGETFTVHTTADVAVGDVADVAPNAAFTLIQDLPAFALIYLLPSRYCESERLRQTALGITGNLPPGYAQVAAIASWVHDNIQYEAGTSAEPISATEVASKGGGVCRDLTHLALGLCRSLSIPARMVVGYLHGLEPTDIHAWFEAYVGGRWYTFDPTQGHPGGARVVLGYGRDASDVAVFNQFGPALIPTTMDVSIERIEMPQP